MNDTQTFTQLAALPRLKIYRQSLVRANNIILGAAQMEDGLRLVALGPAAALAPLEGTCTEQAEETLLIGPTNAHNMACLRTLLQWLNARPLGLHTSAGMGDRLGLATPGHIRAIRATEGKVAPIFAQQSIREMTRTSRSPQQVMDDAAWGVFAEGWREGFGADADHLKITADIDRCVAAGFTFFTIDPGEHVNNAAETMSSSDLQAAYEALPWQALQDSPTALRQRYIDKTIDLEGHPLSFDEHSLLQAAVKYGGVIAHVTKMYQHLKSAQGSQSWEMEISVDETELPTRHLEHIYIVSELRRLGVEWVSLAPRYIGRFEKGVDYLGDLEAFKADFAVHAAIARRYGPYKLSLHSGSDKFSIYPIAASQANGLIHLKTAGTSWLESLRTVAAADPTFFRKLYSFARDHYDTDRATYHVSGQLDQAALPTQLADTELSTLLDQFDARQILHVTFGSILLARTAEGKLLFYDHLMSLLRAHPDAYASNLEAHFRRHLLPFAASTGH